MMLKGLGLVRPFSTTRAILNKPLHLTPGKWLDSNLSSEEILDLHKKRKWALGLNYRFDQAELNALKHNAKAYELTPHQVERLYYEGDFAAAEIYNHPLNSSPFNKPNTLDEYPELAQLKVRQHRERRKYNRIAAYEMPHLVKYRQDYIKPQNKPITFKYIAMLGEEELPINKKCVMTLKTSELGLTPEQLHKFRLLAGVRYDYRTDELKMSSIKFPESLQNTRYLLDTLKNLIKEAKDISTETFQDIPLDKRHIYAKERKRKNRILDIRQNVQFPKEWARPQDAPKVEKTLNDYLEQRTRDLKLASYDK